MPRRPRIHVAGMPMHLVQRGINRQACFFADEDYHCYLHWLQQSSTDWGCAIHAYVLMTNHVHLLLTAARADGPAKLMQSIGRRYVQYVNRAYKRTGSLWEGRYKSSAVQAESYLIACMRYIESNPVRAGMVNDPAQYRWSSYRHNGLGLPLAGAQVYPFEPQHLADMVGWMRQYTEAGKREMDLADASLYWLAVETGINDILTVDVAEFARYRLPDGGGFTLL